MDKEVKNGQIWVSPNYRYVVVVFDHTTSWLIVSLPYKTIDGRTALMTSSINGRMNWSSSEDLYNWFIVSGWELTDLQLPLLESYE